MPRFSFLRRDCSRKKDLRSDREEMVGFHVVGFSSSCFVDCSDVGVERWMELLSWNEHIGSSIAATRTIGNASMHFDEVHLSRIGMMI